MDKYESFKKDVKQMYKENPEDSHEDLLYDLQEKLNNMEETVKENLMDDIKFMNLFVERVLIHLGTPETWLNYSFYPTDIMKGIFSITFSIDEYKIEKSVDFGKELLDEIEGLALTEDDCFNHAMKVPDHFRKLADMYEKKVLEERAFQLKNE